MQCQTCGSQDTKYVTGVSKSGKNAGKPWAAYDCSEPQCKNDKGYPTRTFVPMKKSANPSQSNGGTLPDLQNLMKKVDECLAILQKNFGKVVVVKEEKDEETPF